MAVLATEQCVKASLACRLRCTPWGQQD